MLEVGREKPSRLEGMGLYLKSVEVENFKSFKGEVSIPLDRGFTAITGPNGSGKSNCGDAIQFVLGPKSNRVIRAQNVKDLIFNGGKNSKPARQCKVTLIFANPRMIDGRRRLAIDFDEVEMTREVRLTSSNNAITTYLLNGEESSQKSFHRLLTSANARPDGYNIVLQGDVTSLAKMTAIERRKVLDGVAGVTLYDDEIRKGSKQQEKVEAYIERIDLLQKEQMTRLQTLKEEKKIAEKAKEVIDSIHETKKLLLQSKYLTSKNEVEFQVEERQRYYDSEKNLRNLHLETMKTVQSLDDQIGDLQRQINEILGGEDNKINAIIQDLHVKIARIVDKVDSLNEQFDENAADLHYVEDELVGAQKELNDFTAELSAAETLLKEAMTQLTVAQQEKGQLDGALSQIGQQHQSLAKALDDAESAVEVGLSDVQKAQSEVDKIATQVELLHEEMVNSKADLEQCQIALGEIEIQEDELKDEAPQFDREALSKRLVEAQNAEAKLVEEIAIIESKLRDSERKLFTARQEMESKSGSKGLVGGASSVITARDKGELSGIIGTIAELCAPKNPSHENALGTAIGGGMTSVVVESDEDAARAIRWLNEKNAGRATFLPLNKLTTTRPLGKSLIVAKKEGVVGFAHDLLDFDPRIEIAVQYVLRNTLIVDSLSTARKHMGGVRLVTLQGDVTDAGGAMVGGSSRKLPVTFGGKIQGASEVDKLTSEVERLQLMADTVTAALSEARTIQNEVRHQINQVVENDFTERVQTVRAEKKQMKQQLTHCQAKYDGLEKRLEGLHVQAESALSNLDVAQHALGERKQQREHAFQALQDASPEQLRNRIHENELLLVSAQSQKTQAESSLEKGATHQLILQRRVDELNARKQKLNSSQDQIQIEIVSIEDEKITHQNQLAIKEQERSEFLSEHKELEDSRMELVELRGQKKVLAEQQIEQANQHRRLADEINRTIMDRVRERDEMLEAMLEDGLSEDDLPDSVPNVGELERKLRSLDKKLDEFGAVNMNAIEQYNDVQDRLNLMKDDFASLQSRRKELIQLTEQLEAQRKDRLLKVLKEVNKNFKEAYKILSDGGRGELFLESPEDPFKGGLELWAQPRGKSEKVNRHQLSGGEQSMAALALIFAIQDYDPSPFYYFDEVDQNLDAYNAERIAKMCRTRSKKAQFIMVTLRKVSLMLADHHIGITHGGDGCSRRILDFDRERAIEIGEKHFVESPEDAKINETRIHEAEIVESSMPRIPEELPPPYSLGGLLSHMNESRESGLGHLSERAIDMTEEIEETREYLQSLQSEEHQLEEDGEETLEMNEQE